MPRVVKGRGPSAEGRVDALRRWGKNTVPRVILSKAKDLLQRGSFKILHFVRMTKTTVAPIVCGHGSPCPYEATPTRVAETTTVAAANVGLTVPKRLTSKVDHNEGTGTPRAQRTHLYNLPLKHSVRTQAVVRHPRSNGKLFP